MQLHVLTGGPFDTSAVGHDSCTFRAVRLLISHVELLIASPRRLPPDRGANRNRASRRAEAGHAGHTRRLAAALLGAFCLLAVDSSARATPENGRAFLTRLFNITPADWRSLEHAGVIARTLPETDGREIALLGIVRVPVSPSTYITHLRDIARFQRADAVLAIGRFSTPPSGQDVEALTLDPADIKRLRHCRVSACDLRLPGEWIQQLRRDVDWSAPAGKTQADAVMRRLLVELATQYRSRGAAALPVYNSRERPVSVASEFRHLVESDRLVLPQFPIVGRELLESSAPATDDLLYWSKAKIGPKRVITVTHLRIAPVDATSAVAFVVASQQIYADYYFDASLGLTLLVDDSSAGRDATIVVYVNRSRVDAFGGWFGGITHRIVRSRARSALARFLRQLTPRLEAAP